MLNKKGMLALVVLVLSFSNISAAWWNNGTAYKVDQVFVGSYCCGYEVVFTLAGTAGEFYIDLDASYGKGMYAALLEARQSGRKVIVDIVSGNVCNKLWTTTTF